MARIRSVSLCNFTFCFLLPSSPSSSSLPLLLHPARCHLQVATWKYVDPSCKRSESSSRYHGALGWVRKKKNCCGANRGWWEDLDLHGSIIGSSTVPGPHATIDIGLAVNQGLQQGCPSGLS